MIRGIYFLSKNNFHVKESVDGKLLALDNDMKGINLVLFYSNECEHCNKVISEFKKLPEHIFGCNFSMINVNQNTEIVKLSKETISPLSYVPELILFIDNIPYMKYEGEVTIQDLQKFIKDTSANLEKNSFLSDPTPTTAVEKTNEVVEMDYNSIDYNFHSKDLLTDKPFQKKCKKVCYLEDDTFICI